MAEMLKNRETSQRKEKQIDGDGAQLTGKNLKAYPTAITAETLTVASGTGSNTTTIRIMGNIKLLSIKAPVAFVDNSDTFRISIYSHANGAALSYDQLASKKYYTYKTEMVSQDQLDVTITDATVDGAYELYIQYESGANALYG